MPLSWRQAGRQCVLDGASSERRSGCASLFYGTFHAHRIWFFIEERNATEIHHEDNMNEAMTPATAPSVESLDAFELSVEHHFAVNIGVRTHYAVAGAGALLAFIHGFPDYWLGWRRQMSAASQRLSRGRNRYAQVALRLNEAKFANFYISHVILRI